VLPALAIPRRRARRPSDSNVARLMAILGKPRRRLFGTSPKRSSAKFAKEVPNITHLRGALGIRCL
jgi:hypothetical protein